MFDLCLVDGSEKQRGKTHDNCNSANELSSGSGVGVSWASCELWSMGRSYGASLVKYFNKKFICISSTAVLMAFIASSIRHVVYERWLVEAYHYLKLHHFGVELLIRYNFRDTTYIPIVLDESCCTLIVWKFQPLWVMGLLVGVFMPPRNTWPWGLWCVIISQSAEFHLQKLFGNDVRSQKQEYGSMCCHHAMHSLSSAVFRAL